jgi:hypothetical protein
MIKLARKKSMIGQNLIENWVIPLGQNVLE